jgi:N-acetylmuramoyl-L-alanine amidase
MAVGVHTVLVLGQGMRGAVRAGMATFTWGREVIGASAHAGRTCAAALARPGALTAAAAYTLTAVLIFSAFSAATGVVSSDQIGPGVAVPESVGSPAAAGEAKPPIRSVEDLLRRHSNLGARDRIRISRAVMTSAQKWGVDPFLVASILLARSNGDPFRISGGDTVGVMQIHVPTWASVVDAEGINLFKVEDSVDLGTRILREYIDQHGQWPGVTRYLGSGEFDEVALEYVRRAQLVYGEDALAERLSLRGGRIVIDAGHGGRDAGTIGPTGLTEKQVVLDIANRLKDRIEFELSAEVVLTRDDDRYVPLETRSEIANDAEADLFVSIHANASGRPSSRGFETYFLNVTNSPISRFRAHDIIRAIVLEEKVHESREFARSIQNALATTRQFGEDRGVKPSQFAVLTGTDMPSILAEVSFISNPEDERLLKGAERRQQIAEALFEGVKSYSETLGIFRGAES